MPPTRSLSTDVKSVGGADIPFQPKRNDESAFEQLIAPHEPALRAFVQRQIASAEDVTDVCQEVLLRALRAVDTFEGRSRARTWLLSIAHTPSGTTTER
jgi:DNA-directed RNA polymerase specialized sigma24 family protein